MFCSAPVQERVVTAQQVPHPKSIQSPEGVGPQANGAPSLRQGCLAFQHHHRNPNLDTSSADLKAMLGVTHSEGQA